MFHSSLPQLANLPSPCSNLAGSHGNHDVGCVASTIPLLLLACFRHCSRSGGSATNRHLDDQVNEGLYRQRTCIAIIYVWDFAKETREKKQNSLLTIYGRRFFGKTLQAFYDPIKDRLKEPSLTGISYSFTADGFYEEAYFRAVSNRQSPHLRVSHHPAELTLFLLHLISYHTRMPFGDNAISTRNL